MGRSLTECPQTQSKAIKIMVDEGKKRLAPSPGNNEGKHRSRKVEKRAKYVPGIPLSAFIHPSKPRLMRLHKSTVRCKAIDVQTRGNV